MATLNTRFYLDDLEVDEPEGYDTLAISIVRDDSLHGIGLQASVNSLKFSGAAYTYIEDIYIAQGLTANIIFRAESDCTISGEYEIVVKGKLNIGKKQSHCGNTCFTTLLVETETCESTLNNKFDVDVDVDKLTSQNGLTPLVEYESLGIDMELPARELDYKSEGFVMVDAEPTTLDSSIATQLFIIRPDYGNTLASNFNVTQLSGSENLGFFQANGISPQILWDENLKDFPDVIKVTGRLKGNISWGATSQTSIIKALFWRGEIDVMNFDFTSYGEVIQSLEISSGATGPSNIDFDKLFTEYDWQPTESGADGIYMFIFVNGSNDAGQYVVTFDPETTFKAITTKRVRESTAKVYLVHELLSRLVENITDGCMRVKSAYYGRIDSQPFAFGDDGCGGLRFLTSGLKLRKAPDASFFINLKKLITGLQNIDNIGMGVEEDETIPGYFVLRIEDLDFFYQDIEIMQHLNIPNVDFAVEEERNYSIIKIGYKKWETQANFGLDEFNSNRQYRTNIPTLSGTIDLTADLVAGEYPLEITRDQSFVDTSEADTGYDDDAFIVCLKRLAYSSFAVEQGGIIDDVNIFSPASVYNYRISPVRNLMRWFRSLINAYPNLSDSSYKLFFSSGTGNFKASGQLAEGYGYGSEFCKLEGVDIAENADLFSTVFNDIAKKVPIWKNETVTYNYPMSVADYKKIKEKKYGYITYQCGNGELKKGWIKDIEFTPVKGTAKIILRKSWL
jgi:hypothetical protein